MEIKNLAINTDVCVYDKIVKTDPNKFSAWEVYSKELKVEYRQSIEEGLDIEAYKNVFKAVDALETTPEKEALADVLYRVVMNAKTKKGYAYTEPSDLESIRALRKPYEYAKREIPSGDVLREKIAGAWYGRICGCWLGKPVEGCRTHELVDILGKTGNYPMHRYILAKDLEALNQEDYKFRLERKKYCPDVYGCAPWDDDTNYVVLAQELIKKFGLDFTPSDVAAIWLEKQPKNAYCTAERVAFRNFLMQYEPPYSAVYKNPYREWIGAQIRGDYFGYINPGNPELAAEMAWRDASISHVKNGIYGEMFAAAMIAAAAVTDNVVDCIKAGLAEIPVTSRLYERLAKLLELYEVGMTEREAFAYIHQLYDNRDPHDWCHTISNAMICVAALLYGGGEFGKTACLAVETGFDTDCNAATVGSVIGMIKGQDGIGEEWTAPTNGTLETTIFGVGNGSIDSFIELTMEHMPGFVPESKRAMDEKPPEQG